MKMHSIIAEACFVISILCLGAAYIPDQYWLMAPVLLAMVLFRRIVKKWPSFWISSSLLSGYILLAATGVAKNMSLPPILLGSVAALAGWELADSERNMADTASPEARMRLERQHLRSLAATSGAGLSLALVSSYLNLHYPFGVTVLLVLLAMGAITYGMQFLTEKESSK